MNREQSPTRAEIIRMAREAGIDFDLIDEDEGQIWYITADGLERFAALVAAAEHKRVQQVYTDAATGSVKAAIAYEREACAKVCEQGEFMTFGCVAAAIRARGQA